MLRWIIGLSILMVGASLAPAQGGGTYRRVSSQVSPRGTFELTTYQRSDVLNTVTELRIEGRRPGIENQVLFRGGESTWALIAPDEAWIAVNSAESAHSGLVHLFRRTPEGQYAEAPTQVERQALAALMKVAGRTTEPRFDVFFCYADFWSEASGCLLGHIEARERGSETSSRFYFVYDPSEKRVSLDLAVLNRGAFQNSDAP